MREPLSEYCVRTGNETLLGQWDRARNGPLTPENVSYGSKQRVWWRCEQGHQWQAMVKARTGGTGCPVCANRRLERGENDLATTHPELAAEWHPGANKGLGPRDVVAGTRRKVWWRCSHGHEWEATVYSRAHGAGCPVCAGKRIRAGENDLAALYPALAAQWHPTLNGALGPEDVTACSNRRVWWSCELGHVYRATVASRTIRDGGCPYCAGRRVLPGFNDLAAVEPELAEQWHPTLNGPVGPDMVTCGSRRKVWWQCPEGHSWQAVVYSRTGSTRSGCPVCAGRTARRQHQNVIRSQPGRGRAATIPPPAFAPDDG